jgi:hypothetical protein
MKAKLFTEKNHFQFLEENIKLCMFHVVFFILVLLKDHTCISNSQNSEKFQEDSSETEFKT